VELVKLRYFVGISFEEAAEVLGIAVPTAKQWWGNAPAWLRVALAPRDRRRSPGAERHLNPPLHFKRWTRIECAVTAQPTVWPWPSIATCRTSL
jgi:hypothetical protein